MLDYGAGDGEFVGWGRVVGSGLGDEGLEDRILHICECRMLAIPRNRFGEVYIPNARQKERTMILVFHALVSECS